jgi:hypothetical protein
VSAPALALSFFDAAHEIHGTARAGATLLFAGRKPLALPEGPSIEPAGGGWRAELPGQLALEAEAVAGPADLGGVTAHLVRVRGEAAGRTVDALGTLSETTVAPEWERLDALRTISALVDEKHAVLVIARRPRGAVGHGDEEITARLVEDDAVLGSPPSTTAAAASGAPGSSCGSRARTIRAGAPGSSWPAPRSASRGSRCTWPSSAGASTAARASARTS